MSNFAAIRLKAARIAAGYRTAKEFADRNGIPQPTYHLHEKGDRQLKPDVAERYAAVLGVTAAWLLYGGDDGGPDGAEEDLGNEPMISEPVVEVDVRGGLGPGGIPASERQETSESGYLISADSPSGEWRFPIGFLATQLRVKPADARIIEVDGDSMEPTLRSGDRVMVDIGRRSPSPPGLFALWDGFGVVVKRLDVIPNTDPATVTIVSDNPRHKPYERTTDEVNIIGRVVWFARRL